MREISINDRRYFYERIHNGAYVFPVQYCFYVLEKEAKIEVVRRKKFFIFGPIIEVEKKSDNVFSLAFKTNTLKEFSEFPTKEIKKLELAFFKNKEIENSIVSI
jgi:hypothetical protein